MAYSQTDPAYSSTLENATPVNPITDPDTAAYGQQKSHFADRHRAPTTKDVETNRWTGAPVGTTKSLVQKQEAGEVGGSGVGRQGEYDTFDRRDQGAQEGYGTNSTVGSGDPALGGSGVTSTGAGYGTDGATTSGVRDDGVDVDAGTQQKKTNPLKKVVEAVKNI